MGTYLAIMICLATFEVPVNRLAFGLLFREQSLVLGAAFGVGAVLVCFAHLIGTKLRRIEHKSRPGAQIKRGVALLLLALASATTINLLAGMRQLAALPESEQASVLAQGGPAHAITTIAGTPLGNAGWTLLAINAAIFLVGATAAFLRHDPHPGYEPAWREQERTRRRLTELRDRYEYAFGARQLAFDEQLSALDQLLRETDARISELQEREQAIEPFQQEMAARVANAVRNRSLAFLEGAVAAIKGPITGSLAMVQAMPEEDVRRRIGELVDPGG